MAVPPRSASNKANFIKNRLEVERALAEEEATQKRLDLEAGGPLKDAKTLVADRIGAIILERLRENKDIFNLVDTEEPDAFMARIKEFIIDTVRDQIGSNVDKLGGIDELVWATKRAILNSGGLGDYKSWLSGGLGDYLPVYGDDTSIAQ